MSASVPPRPVGSAAQHASAGDALQHEGKLDQAIVCYLRALTLHADYAGAHNNLGTALARQGRLDLAVQAFESARTLEPGSVDIHINLGNALQQQDRLEEAIACYQQALQRDAAIPELHNNLASAYERQGRPELAITCLQAALRLRPNYPEAYYNMGNALRLLQRFEEAVQCYQHAIALRPADAAAYTNLGTAWHQQGRLEAAVACYRHAVAIAPALAEAHNNLGNALQELGDRDGAEACFRAGIALRHNNPEAHNNLAMALLARGAWAEGWAEFEWRWRTPQMLPTLRLFPQPLWQGETGAGGTLLIHAEQGLGDTLQFCRYAPLAARRGWRVVLEVQQPLLRLARRLEGVTQVLTRGDTLPAFEAHCPMLSLPRAFGTTVDTVPATAGYLSADPDCAAAWGKRLDAALGAPGLRVGLVWAGLRRPWSPGTTNIDQRRSMDLAALAPLGGVPNVHFVSLQKGPAAAEAARAPFPLCDMMFDVQDFADTAGIVANLDLVVGVDTAVIHLAAAMGRPVFLLDRHDNCWRWLTGRTDSVWYSSLRLFRQPQPGNWGRVVAAVASALAEKAVLG
jgi:tetratricopeptide (TPR) repeat protein